MIFLFGNSKQQVVPHGNPNLCEDRILCCSEERLEIEMLRDPFEKLNLPAFSVTYHRGGCHKREIKSQKSNHLHHVWIYLGHYRVNMYSQLIVWDKVSMLGENGLSAWHDESKLGLHHIHKNIFLIIKFYNVIISCISIYYTVLSILLNNSYILL